MCFEKNIFINCPLDKDYWVLLQPLIFIIKYVGYNPKLAPQKSDSAQIRLDKIIEIITASNSGIHDLSRIKSTKIGEYSRMNMPFELGLDVANKRFNNNNKSILVLEKEKYDYQKAISDIAGCDIKNHNNDPIEIIRKVREWFIETKGIEKILGPTEIWNRYNDFIYDFHLECKSKGFSETDIQEISIAEYILFVKNWIRMNITSD